MKRIARMYWIVRAVGWENVPRRAWHIVMGRLGLDASEKLKDEAREGLVEREFIAGYSPAAALECWRTRADRFFTGPRQAAQIQPALTQVADDERWQHRVRDLVDALPRGQMLYFNHQSLNVGWPVDFNHDPIHDINWPTGWSRHGYRPFDKRYKDLKCVWEASRFQTAFLLARDVVRHPASPTGELFWQLLADWDRQNPFAASAGWACGQEATFRLMAWLFAACAFVDAPEARAERYHRLSELACLSGRLIERNIVYARSQKNNHAISEAAGLWTLGLMFPELRRAAQWRERGRRVLCEEIERQIYPDGSYIQHSTNYHRVMMDDVLWAIRLGTLHGDPLTELHAPLSKALVWLSAMIEPRTGRVPNYGANDGAVVLPLTTCDYVDFRPVAQAANYVLHGTRLYPPGPWDEEMLWLCGPESLSARQAEKARPSPFEAPSGGYYTLSGPRSWLFTRIHSFRDRPNQADMLHVDLWYDGANVLRDGGSFHYDTDPPWQHFFESTAGHNTVEVDGQDQMQRGPSFLWFRWTQSLLLASERSLDGRVGFLAGEHYGYRRLTGRVVHRRSIVRILDTYIIVDDLLGSDEHELALRWRLAPAEWQDRSGAWQAEIEGQQLVLRVVAPAGFATRLYRGEEGAAPEGWESLYYADKQPVPTIVTRGQASLPVRMVTVVGPAGAGITVPSLDEPAGENPVRVTGISDRALASEVARLSGGLVQPA
ncbi:MAG TPA: alginate lyase family protein [Pirellulales bacterium]